MIKDKLIQMENGKNYYILEEITYDEKKYLIAIECDLEKDEANDEDYFVMELKIENGELIVKKIEDDKLAVTVTALLLQKIRNS